MKNIGLTIENFTFTYFGASAMEVNATAQSRPDLHYRVFVGNGQHKAQGNACSLRVADPKLHKAPTSNTENTLCLSQLNLSGTRKTRVDVQCFSSGHSIQCCGHGLMASADFWLRELYCPQITLTMSGSEITAERIDQKIWLYFAPIHLQQCQPPAWLTDMFPHHAQHCVAAAKTQEENGYWVLQWSDQTVLNNLQPPSQALAKHSQKALINTCVIEPAQHLVGLRYFAPQYGVEEDTATGSAMRVLTQYWQKPKLTAIQCSALGGLLFGRLMPDKNQVAVGGYCQRTTSLADHGITHE